jgi:microcystin-dependent protein
MSYTKNSITILIPTGGIVAYTGVINVNTPPPAGWLLCNGATYNKSAYPALSTLLVGSYGNTSSGTTFVVPNFQAAFLRGAGTQTYPIGGSTTYGGSAINTAQETATLTHIHTYTSTATTHNHSFSTTTHNHSYTNTGGHAHNSNQPNVLYWPAKASTTRGNYTNSDFAVAAYSETSTTASPSNITVAEASTDVSLGNTNLSFNSENNTTNSTPNETIPFNYAINWIIKY